MARRSTPQSKTDDLAFPVRVKIAVPGDGLRSLPEMHAWLAEEVGAGDYAHHSLPGLGCSTFACYFRTIEAARRFADAFPSAVLADGTTSAVYSSPYRSAHPGSRP